MITNFPSITHRQTKFHNATSQPLSISFSHHRIFCATSSGLNPNINHEYRLIWFIQVQQIQYLT